eukprot:jgi/Botrbrau1/13701/Bobra.250_2s0002.1
MLSSEGLVPSPQGRPSQEQSDDGGLTIRFLASPDPAIREVQQALVEAWGYVSTSYLDPTYNNVDWQKQLQESLDASFGAKNPKEAYAVVTAMLEKLGDPFNAGFLSPAGGASFPIGHTRQRGRPVGLWAIPNRPIRRWMDRRPAVAVVMPGLTLRERGGLLPGESSAWPSTAVPVDAS